METTRTATHTATQRRSNDGAMPGPEPADARSIGELIKEIRDESTTLIREEVELARTEISEKLSVVTRNLLYLGLGGLVAFSGLIVLLIAAGEGVSAWLINNGWEEHALWLGPLVVGAIVAIIGTIMAMKGKSALQSNSLMPEKTAQSLKENKQWVQHKAT